MLPLFAGLRISDFYENFEQKNRLENVQIYFERFVYRNVHGVIVTFTQKHIHDVYSRQIYRSLLNRIIIIR